MRREDRMYGPVVARIEIRASGKAFLKVTLPVPDMDVQRLIKAGLDELKGGRTKQAVHKL